MWVFCGEERIREWHVHNLLLGDASREVGAALARRLGLHPAAAAAL